MATETTDDCCYETPPLPTDLGGWQALADDVMTLPGDLLVDCGKPLGWVEDLGFLYGAKAGEFAHNVYRRIPVAKAGDTDPDHHHKPADKEPSYTQEARKLVLGDRNSSYGNPADDYAKTAKVWSGLLTHKLKPGQEITPKEATMMMVGLKLCREMHKHKADNLIDAIGYCITAEWIEKGEKPQ